MEKRKRERKRENSNSKHNELFGIQMSSQDELHNTFQILRLKIYFKIILRGLFKNIIKYIFEGLILIQWLLNIISYNVNHLY